MAATPSPSNGCEPPATQTADQKNAALFSLCPEVMGIQQACKVLGLSPNTVRAMIYERQLPATKLGGKWRILRSDLAALFVPQ